MGIWECETQSNAEMVERINKNLAEIGASAARKFESINVQLEQNYISPKNILDFDFNFNESSYNALQKFLSTDFKEDISSSLPVVFLILYDSLLVSPSVLFHFTMFIFYLSRMLGFIFQTCLGLIGLWISL